MTLNMETLRDVASAVTEISCKQQKEHNFINAALCKMRSVVNNVFVKMMQLQIKNTKY